MKPLAFITASLLAASAVRAQDSTKVQSKTTRDSAAKLDQVRVSADRDRRSTLNKLTLPVSASITAQHAFETVNIVDTEDAVKYLPSVFIRKRNNGDTQATLSTRVWGPSSSARTLIYADGVPITALIANNNNIGGPRWGLVAPEEIERIDMMYGPYSAAYAGNSIGAVMEITTKLPEKFVASVNQTQSVQAFNLYGTKSNYGTAQTAIHIGDRFGKFTVSASGNYQDSHSQPLSYVVGTTFPAGTTGGFPAQNKLGVAANVLGASGMLHTKMVNANVKLAYDITPAVRLAYAFGFWQNDANAGVDPYLRKADQPSFAAQAGFASGNYALLQQHTSQSVSLRTDTKKDWDYEVVATQYSFDTDKQRFPISAAATGLTFSAAGRAAVLSGTGWTTFDAKAAWHAGGLTAAHIVSVGAHYDRYTLFNPTYNTSDWLADAPSTSVATEGDGKTRTQAVWVQDAWRITNAVKFTFGARYEEWKGFDGFNVNGATQITQPTVRASKYSPKATLSWSLTPQWTLTASVAKAYRFSTAGELYQLVATGTTFTSPDPSLKPDNVLSSDFRAERQFDHAHVQLALFNDDVHDAILSQFNSLVPGSTTLYSFVSNVDHVRARGAEMVMGTNNWLVRGLEFNGSVTYLDAKILALSGRASASAAAGTSVGKVLPNIPKLRATFATTYRPVSKLSLTVGGRYSDLLYTTLDNADVNPNTYQGFAPWFVADANVNYRVSRHWNASLGADNLLNRKYFLFHPFPQRSFVSSVRFVF